MPLEPFVGQIMPAGFGIVPRNWAPCDGRLLPVQNYQALFSLLGVTYGGNGVATFALPDLRGRAVLGCNLSTVAWGLVSGTETVTLTVDQLPRHNHMIQATTRSGTGRAAPPTNKIFATTTAEESIFAPAGSNEVPLVVGGNVGYDGGSLPHNNMQPYLVVNYLIALSGIFPPRP